MRRQVRILLLILLSIPGLSTAQTGRFADGTARLHSPRTHNFDVQSYVLRLALDHPQKSLSGSVTITLNPVADGLTQVVLDSAELRIQKVEQDGAALKYGLNGDKLQVDLSRPFKKSETISLTITYDGHPRKGLYWVGGDPAYPSTPMQIWSQGEDEDSRYWFPCYDYPNDKATTETYVTVKKPFRVVSNGALVDVKDLGATRTFHWKMDVPHSTYLTSVAVGDFEEYRDKVGDVSVEYYVPRGTGRDKAYRSFGMTPRILQYFSQRVGIPYPYSKYAQVAAANFIFGGMENISATTQNATTLHDERAEIDSKSDTLVAHELAHQWWGDLITPADWSHFWLSEGFASYFEALYARQFLGEDEYRFALYQNAETYFREDRSQYRRPLVTSIYTDPTELFDAHAYEKGSIVLGMLHNMLGDEAFFKALKNYGTKFARQNVTTDDFRHAIEESTGKNLEVFFDQWLYQAGYPEFEVRWKWLDGTAEISVRQKQKIDAMTPVFKLPVVVDFMLEDKVSRQFTIDIQKADETFSFPLPSRPVLVRFDPGNNVLKRLDFTKTKTELLYQAQNDPDIIGRIRAIDELANVGVDPAVNTALVEVLKSSSFYGVRTAAASGLGRIRGAAALTALIQAGTDRDWHVRRAAVSALANFERDETAADAVESALQKDESYKVQAAAAVALGKIRSPRSFNALTAALRQESHNDVVRQSALSALTVLGPREKVRPIILEWTAYGKYPATRAMAVALLSRLADGDTPAITRRLIELLNDPWIYTRESAIVALGELEAVEALGALEASAQKEFDGRLRKEARESIAQIRSGSPGK